MLVASLSLSPFYSPTTVANRVATKIIWNAAGSETLRSPEKGQAPILSFPWRVPFGALGGMTWCFFNNFLQVAEKEVGSSIKVPWVVSQGRKLLWSLILLLPPQIGVYQNTSKWASNCATTKSLNSSHVVGWTEMAEWKWIGRDSLSTGPVND